MSLSMNVTGSPREQQGSSHIASTGQDIMQHEHNEDVGDTAADNDAEDVYDTSPTSTSAQTPFRRTRSLRINTSAHGPASETSSIVPTSARLSIASTTYPLAHRSLNQNMNASGDEAIPTLLDDILQNPGWMAAAQSSEARRQRRHSLLSMRSLAPTLPPYEEFRNHILIPEPGVGSSFPRHRDSNVPMVRGEKARAQSVRFADEETRSLPEERQAVPDHHEDEGEESALIAHYSRVVRTIDSRYTAEVARLAQENQRAVEEFERETARMRNEIDATYRTVLKERDKTVERAKEEAASQVEELEGLLRACKIECEEQLEVHAEEHRELEQQLKAASERGVEKARHEVEDVWERRWRDRMALVEEELARRVRERDAEWLAFLHARDPELCQIAEEAMAATLA